MKKVLTFVFLGFFAVSSFAATAATMESKNSSASSHQLSQHEMQKKDGQIVEILMIIDAGEIKAAKVALKRTSKPNVKDFANLMIRDHGKNLQEAKKLGISPVVSEKSKLLEKNGKNGLKNLKSVPENEFNKTYIDAMVTGHKQALEALDTELLPKASSPELIKFLKATRIAVKHHLEMAEEMQNKKK